MKISGNETATVLDAKVIFKLGKYRFYKVWLQINIRYIILDYEIKDKRIDSLKRIRIAKGKYIFININN